MMIIDGRSPAPAAQYQNMPHVPARVQDPQGRHAFFATPRHGTRVGQSMLNGMVWQVFVLIAGRTYYVWPAWVKLDEPDAPAAEGATIIPFPSGGRRGWR